MSARVGAAAVAVLGKALFHAGDGLGLTEAELSAALAVDLPRLQALRRGLDGLQPQTEEWRRALQLVELYQGLLAVMGTEYGARQWLCSHNLGLRGRPLALIRQRAGLEQVITYLRAARSPPA
jgi:uncharacterized protein (DUF2384 family)